MLKTEYVGRSEYSSKDTVVLVPVKQSTTASTPSEPDPEPEPEPEPPEDPAEETDPPEEAGEHDENV